MKHTRLNSALSSARPAGLAITAWLLLVICGGLTAQDVHSGTPSRMPGLLAAAEIIRDTNGIAHVRATNDHDLFYLQGYVHAQDRLFQMDYMRHVGSGTVAEMLGKAALAQDVKLRTLGLRRAAERSWAVGSERIKVILQAYAAGVNAYMTSHPNTLPPEYAALGITQVDPWVPVDSLAIVKLVTYTLTVPNDFDIDFTTAFMSYQQAGAALGFDGTKLFYDDLVRSAPFDPASTVPDASAQNVVAATKNRRLPVPRSFDPEALELSRQYLRQIETLEFFRKLREGRGSNGSNQWVVGGNLTSSGVPLFANDPHLDLPYPSTFYPIHLSAGAIDVVGQSFAGVPTVIIGHNPSFSWGATAALVDLLDYYKEQVVPDSTSPSGISTLHRGALEHVTPVPETYRARVAGQLVTVPPGGGIPPATMIVPRRNNGPIVQFNAATGAAISMQWTGFSGGHELEATLAWAEARTVEDFERGVRLFTFPQNFTFIDRAGNFGYYMAGEVPIREDLQGGAVLGLPPWMLRDGKGGNEWLPAANPAPDQALPYEIIPFQEMPRIVNPPAGWVVNANNDPLGLTLGNDPLGTSRPGGGIYYLGYMFLGQRAGRITELLKNKVESGPVSVDDIQRIQADTVLADARFFVPFITQAFNNARQVTASSQLALIALDPAVAEAVQRLSAWDFTSPTGLAEGCDAFDIFGQPNPRPASKIANSVAATIYALWRSQFIASVIDSKLVPYGLPVPNGVYNCLPALRHLLESFPGNQGVGSSGMNFFALAGVPSAADRRDIYILKAVKDALIQLAGDGFKNAFQNSTNQNDYRWGKLNRIVFVHPLGSAFSVPPAGVSSPLSGLPGIPLDGGLQTVDPTSKAVRVTDQNTFMITYGPAQRSIAEAFPSGIRGLSSLAGGISGVVGNPLYWNLLPGWLTNSNYYDQYFGADELQGHISSVLKLVPSEQATRAVTSQRSKPIR